MKEPDYKVNKYCSSSSRKLVSWDLFSSLCGAYFHVDEQKTFFSDSIDCVITYISHISSLLDDEDDTEGIRREKLKLISEQLELMKSNVKRYTPDLLLWAFQLFTSHRKTYNFVRDSVLTLPHLRYLTKLSTSFSMDTGIGDNPVHETYLRQKASALCPVERNVITMMDEIHTGTEFSYRGGKVKGAAMDSTVDASTAQVCTPLFANNNILIIILLIICCT